MRLRQGGSAGYGAIERAGQRAMAAAPSAAAASTTIATPCTTRRCSNCGASASSRNTFLGNAAGGMASSHDEGALAEKEVFETLAEEEAAVQYADGLEECCRYNSATPFSKSTSHAVSERLRQEEPTR